MPARGAPGTPLLRDRFAIFTARNVAGATALSTGRPALQELSGLFADHDIGRLDDGVGAIAGLELQLNTFHALSFIGFLLVRIRVSRG